MEYTEKDILIRKIIEINTLTYQLALLLALNTFEEKDLLNILNECNEGKRYMPGDFEVLEHKKGEKYKTVKMSLGNDRVRLIFPKMRVKFINKNKLDLCYERYGSNERLRDTFEKINMMDNYILEKAKEYSNEWFSKSNLDDVTYLKQNKQNGNYDPLFRVKVVESRRGEMLSEFFNSKKEMINIDNLDDLKGKMVDGIYEASELWFMEVDNVIKFGVIWNIVQMKVHDNGSDELSDFSFIDE